MDAESNNHHLGEPRVLRFTGAMTPTRPPLASPEAEFAELSIAEFQRFLRAAHSPTRGGKVSPLRRTRALTVLAVGLIALTALTYFVATREREEDTAHAAEAARLKREVCQVAMGFTRHSEPLESVCQVHP
jgi:hypothetical protein